MHTAACVPLAPFAPLQVSNAALAHVFEQLVAENAVQQVGITGGAAVKCAEKEPGGRLTAHTAAQEPVVLGIAHPTGGFRVRGPQH